MITESMGIIIFSIVTAICLTILAAVAYVSSVGAPAERQVLDTYKLTTTTTTILKNQAWPVIGKKAPEPCTINYCEDV